MTAIGDYEPEDAWDPGDPFPVLFDNLLRRIALLDDRPVNIARRAVIDESIGYDVASLVAVRDSRTERDRLRIDQLVDDVAFLRTRDG